MIAGEIAIRGIIADFDLTKLQDLREFRAVLVKEPFGAEPASVDVELSYHVDCAQGEFMIVIEIAGVKQFDVGKLTSPSLSLVDILCVEDMSDDGWEGCNYRILDMCEDILVGYARDVRFTKLIDLSNGDAIELVEN
ncbi:MAG: hypothetical protein KDA54_19935 [Phycisphaerales bacterium]|nr:hypothetical protein [Phycisphaerales bacterium]